jgi:hypothetical protein
MIQKQLKKEFYIYIILFIFFYENIKVYNFFAHKYIFFFFFLRNLIEEKRK